MRRHATSHELPSCGVATEKAACTWDCLWKEFFRDPSQWWDYRIHSKCPDFKHKLTGQPLWMHSWRNPSWVHAELRSRGLLDVPSHESLWKEFFRDPSQWWHYHTHDPSSRYPDFKHKLTDFPLWIESRSNPSWVHAELRSQGFFRAAPYSPAAQIFSFTISLRTCARDKDLVRGTKIHHDLVQSRLVEQCSDALLTMYACCGQLGKAKVLLVMHKSKDVCAWTALVAGYVQKGQGHRALDILEEMQHEGILPNEVTYTCALKACAMVRAADKGKYLHDKIVRQGLLVQEPKLVCALVNMYAKCGATLQAWRVLEEFPSQNAYYWNALISGYKQEGEAEQALNCLEQMQQEGILPKACTYGMTLGAFIAMRASHRGEQLQKETANVPWKTLICRLHASTASLQIHDSTMIKTNP